MSAPPFPRTLDDPSRLLPARPKQHLQRFHAKSLHGGVFFHGEQAQTLVHGWIEAGATDPCVAMVPGQVLGGSWRHG